MHLSKPHNSLSEWHGYRFRRRLCPSRPSFFGASLLILAFLFQAASAFGRAPEEFLKQNPQVPWHVSADTVRYDEKEDVYIAEGNVVVTKENKRLTADFVRFDQKSMKALAEGHVIVTAGEDILSGSRVEMNLNTQTGTIYDGTVFLKQNHFYIHGAEIHKTGEATYTAQDVSVTTCDGPAPAWKITARDLQVTIEGYGTVTHAALWARRLPLLYTPILVFPVRLKRQSGFLPPEMGNSDRKGIEYNQPFFWAISDSTDATFYGRYMQERGEMLGAEYRYILSGLSKGTAMYDFLDDRKVDNGIGDSSTKWGYPGDGFLRPNSDRYWFRMKNDQALPLGFSGQLDLDIVSDQDYLTEFRSGYTGFDATNAYFLKTFGRGLDDYNDYVRTNRLNLNRIWANYNLNIGARWNDNVVYRRQKLTTPPLQQLPYGELNAPRQPIAGGPFFYSLESSYDYFYREEGTTGHRTDIYPRLYFPYRYRHYFSFEPSVGLRGTAWHTDEEDSVTRDRDYFRGIYDFRADLTSDIYRVYQVNWRDTDRIKHTLQPQIVWEYTPHQDQSEYPLFDSLDRIPEQNLLTYSLTNFFTSRSQSKGTLLPAAKDRSSTPRYSYQQFARLKLVQSYDIKKAWNNEPEPFSPIQGELEFVFNRYFALQADAGWSQYTADFTSHNVAASFADTRGDRLYVEHRYTQGEVESIYTDLLLQLTAGISAYASYESDLLNDKRIKSTVGGIYKAQCWSFDLRYTDEQDDRSFEFTISLYGLGEVGTSLGMRTIETPLR